VPGSARLGIGLILLGITAYAGTARWMRTRTVYPVNIPVSLATGHIRTAFRLNLSAVYWVIVDSGDWWKGGRLCPDPRLRAKTRWVLYKRGAIVDRSDDATPTGWPTGFDVGPGVYDLDVEVLSDTSCLDPGHPRLRVFAQTENYEMPASMLKAVTVLSVFLGVVLLTFLPATRAVFSREESDSLTNPSAAGQNFQWAQRLPLRRPFGGLPAFGLFGAMMFGLLAVLMMLLTVGFQQTSIGLRVHLLKPGQVPQKSDAWTDPLIVLLKDAGPGQEPQVLVNSTQVDWNNLDTTLKHELARRFEWTVYVGGDDCVSWVNVTNVIDIARSNHAKVFLFSDPKRKRCEQPVTGRPATL